jgi:putative transposase
MPKGLIRYQKCGVFHFLTFSCYRRLPLLASEAAYTVFERELECGGAMGLSSPVMC